MSIQRTIARKLFEWRDQNLTSTIPNDLLTPDELAEAIRLRWVESEIAEHRHITTYQARLEEMGDASKSLAQGDTVTIGEDGESFQATVSEVTPAGIKLSFKDKAPKNSGRLYQKTELNPVATPKVSISNQRNEPVNPVDDRGRHDMFRVARGFMN